jgi:type II secretory pathway pseudopilin PulG
MIELLFVIVVVGVMLAVITPRAYRANIDAKYGAVRQGAVELTSYALDWVNQGISSQDRTLSTANMNAYLDSLVSGTPQNPFVAGTGQEWIALSGVGTSSNWNTNTGALAANRVGITGRHNGLVINAVPEITIQEMIPGVKVPVNPFNGANVFSAANDPAGVGAPVTGAIACAGFNEGAVAGGGWFYYALVFQGTDVTGATFAADTSFHAGQGVSTLAGLRNGIFLARER